MGTDHTEMSVEEDDESTVEVVEEEGEDGRRLRPFSGPESGPTVW